MLKEKFTQLLIISGLCYDQVDVQLASLKTEREESLLLVERVQTVQS